MTRYEYKKVVLTRGKSWREVGREFGPEGWQPYQLEHNSLTGERSVILIRRKPAEKKPAKE